MKATISAQSESYLNLLLEYLVCPLDSSIPLTTVHNSTGETIALKSGTREYPVINNIPCMIPDLGESRGAGLALWRDLQDAAWQEYQAGDEGVFSAEDDLLGRGVGQIINQGEDGLFLDVGCGPLSLPSYMAVSDGGVSWIGIDPYFGDAARQFPFAQALAEYLPFQPRIFDGVLYAGSVDHVIDPWRSLASARCVIKPGGKLYVWYVLRRADLRYFVWKTMRALGLAWRYNPNHQWAFTHKSLRVLLESAGFAVDEVIPVCERYCPDYSTCAEPSDFLAVAHCI